MAEKSFGVKDLNIVGASGDPTIESNGDLNLKAGQVAIQTNTTVTGVVTASGFVGDGSGLTGVTGSGSGIIVKDGGSAVGKWPNLKIIPATYPYIVKVLKKSNEIEQKTPTLARINNNKTIKFSKIVRNNTKQIR